ncbi:MAG: thiamine diphosphokinase [Succiniclasticum sp.]|jgi:thiamine pyrophosphokinase|nr:thiamine diphosphokinase [Succiniclasticum sp.]MCI6221992.1 thiamine diphosphokinase [Selenomonadales bacterium]MDY2870667.1 thiamine diphosphokinase [Succiniclasticum sp.]MDY6303257.1 thiamine diphosphokinase [Succiniclasticum sp.]MDY6346638.1 thiamine diphosphokinase [Succiniclasticum sp.]
MDTLKFPQGTLTFQGGEQAAAGVVFAVAGGRKPAREWLRQTLKLLPHNTTLAAADKGLDYLADAGAVPGFVVGDGDSATDEAWQAAKQAGLTTEYDRDKDFTDLQLLLEAMDDRKFWLFSGVFGGRFDHLFSAVHSIGAQALHQKQAMVLADEREICVFVPAGTSVSFYPPAGESPVALSLLPFTEESMVSVEGVKWPLDKKILLRDMPYSVSNVMSDAELEKEMPCARCTCHTGMTIFYICG